MEMVLDAIAVVVFACCARSLLSSPQSSVSSASENSPAERAQARYSCSFLGRSWSPQTLRVRCCS
jgi:hypothetical protein